MPPPVQSSDRQYYRPRFRPQLLALEDRNAPGSLLGELIAATLANATPLPLDQVGMLLGAAAEPIRPGSQLTIAAGEPARPAADAEPAATGLQQRPQEDDDAPDPAPTVGIDNAMGSEDLFFLTAPTFQTDAGGAAQSGVVVTSNGGVSVRVPTGAIDTAPAVDLARADDALLIARPASTHEADPASAKQPADFAPTALDGVSVDNGLTSSTANFETIDDLPPNEAPVAVDDAATVNEDGSVVIDVLANDTDADPDTVLRIDTWDWQPPNGTVTQTVEGKLLYTPFPDFNGMETFTYMTTDGRDVSNTATVTITVNGVADAPSAFNDFYPFANNVAYDPNWDPEIPYTYDGVHSTLILANDRDADGGTIYGVAGLDTTGTVGTIELVDASSGQFAWHGPSTFLGETEFRYRAIGSTGILSEWTTVRVRAFYPAAFPEPAANPDLFVFGDGPASGNVLANDSGGSVAVLQTHPWSGRITTFGYGGGFVYAPGVTPSDVSFMYKVFAATGGNFSVAVVDGANVNLEIFNGQGAKTAVSGANDIESKIGAFTVVNMNDTDGDGKVDNEDGWVNPTDKNSPGVGFSESDLMQLTVHRPNVPIGQQGPITISLNDGMGKLYAYQEKSAPSGNPDNPLLPGGNFPISGSAFDLGNGEILPSLTFWLEIYFPSESLRSVSVTMTYGGVSDVVTATGVWVNISTPGAFHAGGGTKASADANNPAFLQTFNRMANLSGFELGLPPMLTSPINPTSGKVITTVVLRNTMEMEFVVSPAGIEREAGGKIRFDITRSVEGLHWAQKVGEAAPVELRRDDFPAFRESVNDDVGNRDEDNEPTNRHIYSLDNPGAVIEITPEAQAAGDFSGGYTRRIQHMNAQEFVRVKLDGSAFHTPSGNGLKGSRASELVDWRTWMDFTWNGTTWVRTANNAQNTFNEMTLGPPRDVNTPAVS